jgi:hypothetical protein
MAIPRNTSRPILPSRRARTDGKLYARAIPEKVEITETYSVTQDISTNPSLEAGSPEGHIEIAVPFDGRDYFTRQAAHDVEFGTGGQPGNGPGRVVIGHLLLADHTKTDLRGIMRQHNSAGVIPLEVPIPGRPEQLTDDRGTCVVAYDYRPETPEVYPVWLEVALYDPDSVQLHAIDQLTQLGHVDLGRAINWLMRTARFTGGLEMSIRVGLAIPVKQDGAPPSPKVKLVSVDWPVITSLHSVQLERGTTQRERDAAKPAPGKRGNHDNEVPEEKPHAVRYNPDLGRLEWESVPVNEGTALEGSPGTRVFSSVEMRLNITHPGELFVTRERFQRQTLAIHAEVEIDGYLLSGLEAWLFDATGDWQRLPRQAVSPQSRDRKPWQPKLTTCLSVDTTFFVTDEFSKREFRPYQQYIFDGVVPDEGRITDILTILNTSNFETEWRADAANKSSSDSPRWLLRATRQEGTSWLTLLIAVDGWKYSVDQESLKGAGQTKLTFGRESGRMRVSVLGMLPRDHAVLAYEMNHLQQALRERFQYQQGL